MPDNDDGLTYAKAGVDIEEEAQTVNALASVLAQDRDGPIQALDLPGHFAGGVQLGDTALVLCTDGVGSKVIIADALERYDTIGIDCIAMNVNDAVCLGAEPVAFVDYLAVESHNEAFARNVGEGLARGAKEANVAIVGGETATLPGVVHAFDIAGTCLATAPVSDLVTGERVEPGDILLGIPSSGIHSNGLTLARSVLDANNLDFNDTVEELERSIGEELLEPTRIYVKDALSVLDAVPVHGLVHVTGGGVLNYPRVKPDVAYVLDGFPEPLPVFEAIQRLGSVAQEEMLRTFNMGVGFAIIVPEEHETQALEALPRDAFRLGRIEDGSGVKIPHQDLAFDPEP